MFWRGLLRLVVGAFGLAAAACQPSVIDVWKGEPPTTAAISIQSQGEALASVYARERQVWALNGMGSVLHSTDAGATWNAVQLTTGVTVPLEAQLLSTIQASQDGMQMWLSSTAGGMIWSSEDRGQTWTMLSSGEQKPPAGSLFIVPDGSTFRRLDKNRVWTSTDRGQTWRETVVHPLPTITLRSAVSNATGTNLWMIAGGARHDGSGFLFVSEDSGETWQTVELSFDPRSLVCLSACRRVCVGGNDRKVSCSDDGARTWSEQVVSGDFNLMSQPVTNLVATDGPSGACALVGAYLACSHDQRSWSVHASPVASPTSLAFAKPSRVVMVGRDGAIVSTDDRGRNWTTHKRPMLMAYPVAGEVSPAGGVRCEAGGGNDSIKLACSTDGGASWVPGKVPVLPSTNASHGGKPVPPSFPALVGISDNEWVAAGELGLLLRSADAGKTWVSLPYTKEPIRALDASEDGNVVVGVGAESHVIVSRDRGLSWREVEGPSRELLLSAYVAPAGTEIVVAGKQGLIARCSFDGEGRCSEWSESFWEANLHDIVGSADGKLLWAVGDRGTIVHSSDAGTTWRPSRTGVVAGNLRHVAISNDGRTLIAAPESTLRLTISRDGGESWSDVDSVVSPFMVRANMGAAFATFAVGDQIEVWSRSSMLTGLPWQAKATVSQGRSFPVVRESIVEGYSSGRLRIALFGDGLGQLAERDLEFWLGSSEAGIDLRPRKAALLESRTTPSGCEATFDVRQAGLAGTESLDLDVVVNAEGQSHRYQVARNFPFLRFALVREHPRWVVAGVGVILALGILSLLLWLKPAVLLRAYEVEKHADDLQSWLSWPVRMIVRLIVIPVFASRHRVMDAWVQRHREQANARLAEALLARRPNGYVPLPVRVGSSSAVLDQPSATELRPLLAGKRTLVQIVGQGGSGKTSLALEMVTWICATETTSRLLQHPAIVVPLTDGFEDVVGAVNARLRAWLGLPSDLPAALVEALLQSRRLVVLVDGATDTSDLASTLLERILGRAPVNAMIVACRKALSFSGEGVILQPEPLDSATLLRFITGVIAGYEHRGGFGDLTKQLELGARFVPILDSSGDEVKVTPLLVRLFVEKAVEIQGKTGSLDDLPTSVPDLYFDYILKLVRDHGVANIETLGVSRVLAVRAMGESYIPREVALEEATKAVSAAGYSTEGIDLLVAAGLLRRRRAGAAELVSFMLDPIAEYAAAFAFAHEAGSDQTAWRQRIAAIRAAKAEGLELALKLTWEKYRSDYQWASVDWARAAS